MTQAIYAILKGMSHQFTTLDCLALFVGALCHDIDHRGYTNLYMTERETPLAALYPGSVMEQHHFRYASTLLQDPELNIFNRFTIGIWHEPVLLLDSFPTIHICCSRQK